MDNAMHDTSHIYSSVYVKRLEHKAYSPICIGRAHENRLGYSYIKRCMVAWFIFWLPFKQTFRNTLVKLPAIITWTIACCSTGTYVLYVIKDTFRFLVKHM